ncbi:pentatricopeptide repeat-containing protein At2g13600-like [Carex rostrata]
MVRAGIVPTRFTFTNVLSSCATLEAAYIGQKVHSYVVKQGFKGYVKIGNVTAARNIFDMMKYHDVVAWMAMIVGYDQNRFNSEAMDPFRIMLKEGTKPNCCTLSSILSVCATLSAIEKGKQIHCRVISLRDINAVLGSNVALSMYARCGNVTSARQVFGKI